MATIPSIIAMPAADGGISPSINGAACSAPAAIDSIVYMEYGNGTKNNLRRVPQIESVCEKSTRAQHAWDSGLVTVLVTDPHSGCKWKNFHPIGLKRQIMKLCS